MKLKNIIKIGSFGFAVALSSTAQSQTYMCQACPAGTYSNGSSTSCTPCPAGKFSYTASSSCSTCPAGTYSAAGSGTCTPCPAGQYSNTNGATSCQKCPAGTYANSTGSSSCTPCPDYYWSNAGANQCGRIQLRLQYWAEQCPNTKYTKWIDAGTNWTCANRTMGGDPCDHKTKFCSVNGMAFVKEETTFAFDCKKLPCTFTYKDYNRTITLNANGTITYGGGNFGGTYTNNQGNLTW